VDTGGIDPSTGGKEPLSLDSADYIKQIRAQAEMAIREADAVLFLVDASAGVTPADQEVAQILRRNRHEIDGKLVPPVFVVANKADSSSTRDAATDFYQLGMGDPYPISAVHGTNTGDLLDDLVNSFPKQEEAEEDDSVKIAIVGKPNVGKSSLLNKLAGEERAIVSPIAGTTRDAIDSHIVYGDIPITLIDTAGIRRRGKVDPGVEKYSVIRSMRSIERSEVALLLLDATDAISAQDAHIAGYILEARKSCVVIVNKWDAIEKDNFTMEQYTEIIRKELNFMAYVPILFISVKTGQRVDDVLPMALKVQEERLARLSTSQLNAIIQAAQDAHSISSKTGKEFRMYYGTQVRSDPPTFMIYCNDPKIVHFSYLRYLENRIRSEYPYTGTPLHLVFKARH
jgi:GTP-binding protein